MKIYWLKVVFKKYQLKLTGRINLKKNNFQKRLLFCYLLLINKPKQILFKKYFEKTIVELKKNVKFLMLHFLT